MTWCCPNCNRTHETSKKGFPSNVDAELKTACEVCIEEKRRDIDRGVWVYDSSDADIEEACQRVREMVEEQE